MNARKPAPIGPLALALRHRGSGRRIVLLAIVVGIALLAGIGLLFLR